jgi:putative ABC transport system substrate-binding protein
MSNKILVFALSALLVTLCASTEAQQSKKVYRIGYLSSRLGIEAREEAFLKGLRELGYVEGQNIIIEWRFTKGKENLRTTFAAELVRLKVGCIVSSGTESTLAAKRATTINCCKSNGYFVVTGVVSSYAEESKEEAG